jgi:Zn-dependent alcohol dehydrogenase
VTSAGHDADAPRQAVATEVRASVTRKAGRLRLDLLITCRIALEEVESSFEALERGETPRSVITFADT